jgi:uncharacterized protein DUF5946
MLARAARSLLRIGEATMAMRGHDRGPGRQARRAPPASAIGVRSVGLRLLPCEGRSMTSSATSCPDCGAPLGGRDGCRERFHTLSVRASTDPSYARLHRLAVDAYALQHSDEYCRSAKSLTAHLTGVCAMMERDHEVSRINDAVQRWLSRNPVLERPAPPTSRGSFTVADLGDDPSGVRAWAASAWEAWTEHHAVARSWIEMALGRRQ